MDDVPRAATESFSTHRAVTEHERFAATKGFRRCRQDVLAALALSANREMLDAARLEMPYSELYELFIARSDFWMERYKELAKE